MVGGGGWKEDRRGNLEGGCDGVVIEEGPVTQDQCLFDGQGPVHVSGGTDVVQSGQAIRVLVLSRVKTRL